MNLSEEAMNQEEGVPQGKCPLVPAAPYDQACLKCGALTYGDRARTTKFVCGYLYP